MDEEGVDRSEILRINGVEMRTFRRPKTWNVPTAAKIRLARKQKQENPTPPINLDLIYGHQPLSNRTPTYRYYKPKYFKIAADGTKTEVIPVSNGLEPFPFGGLAALAAPGSFAEMKGEPIIKRPRDDIGESSKSVVENLNPAADSDEVQAGSFLKHPHEDLGESSETVVENLNPAATDLGTKAKVEGDESSETEVEIQTLLQKIHQQLMLDARCFFELLTRLVG